MAFVRLNKRHVMLCYKISAHVADAGHRSPSVYQVYSS